MKKPWLKLKDAEPLIGGSPINLYKIDFLRDIILPIKNLFLTIKFCLPQKIYFCLSKIDHYIHHELLERGCFYGSPRTEYVYSAPNNGIDVINYLFFRKASLDAFPKVNHFLINFWKKDRMKKNLSFTKNHLTKYGYFTIFVLYSSPEENSIPDWNFIYRLMGLKTSPLLGDAYGNS